MRHEIKTFSDIDNTVNEIRYWLDHGDYDRAYSNRGYILERARDLLTPMYVHLWMIMYPLDGEEHTRTNNIQDLSEWFIQVINRIKGKINLITVYTELTGNYLQYVRGELHKHHGYPDLRGKSGDEISNKMADIFGSVNTNIMLGKQKDKHYQITKQKIQELIKEALEL